MSLFEFYRTRGFGRATPPRRGPRGGFVFIGEARNKMSDEQLAVFLRGELERLTKEDGDGDEQIVAVHVPPWMYKRMAEIVIGNVRLSAKSDQ